MQTVQAARASAILYTLLMERGDQHPWLLPANICPIVPMTFLKARVPFQFVDISSQSLHMDLEQAEQLVRKGNYGGLLFAHTYGEASTPNEFFESIRKLSPDLMIIDDRCLCIPELEPHFANKADVQLYSTGYAKIVDLSFGGYAFVSDGINYRSVHLPFRRKDHDEIERAYKEFIRRRTKFAYQDSDWLDTETAVPAWDDYRRQIEQGLVEASEHRALLNQIYARMLPSEIQLPTPFQTWRFNIRVRDKRRILEAIFSSHLFASSHYASLVGIMDDGTAPQAEALAERVINLFSDHHFTADQAEQVCKIILENLA
jgi:dTDP-4-amino-4,6-dideoxygalactose transaminase